MVAGPTAIAIGQPNLRFGYVGAWMPLCAVVCSRRRLLQVRCGLWPCLILWPCFLPPQHGKHCLLVLASVQYSGVSQRHTVC